jgi:predicted transport protein
MEQLFGHADGSEAFDRFVRDYLTLKTGQIPRIDQVYEAFKAYAATTDTPRGELVADIHRFAKLWVRLAFEQEPDPHLRAAIVDINRLKVDVAYPFLLDVLDDEHNQKVSREDAVRVFRWVESYVFRRAICAIPTNTLNKTFAGLAREIDEEAYMESFSAALISKESYVRMPTDEEFRSQLVVRDVYNFRNRNYLLDKLENFDRKERVRVDEYTIEHVMPQNPDLSPEWQADLGPGWQLVQERLLHTLGNLTLTGYNSELSDRSFTEKLGMKGGFLESPLRLNRYLAGLTTWNDREIERRAEQLADTAVKVWAIPTLPEQALAKYRRSKSTVRATYTLADHPELTGRLGEVFEELRRRVLNLDAGVREQIRKNYIAYKYAGNFLSLVGIRTELKLYLAIDVDSLDDPKSLAKDVSGVGHHGTGNTGLRISDTTEVDDAVALIQQALNRQLEEGFDEPQWPEAAVESLIERIGNPDLEQAVRGVLEAAVRARLYPRPWTRSLMFAPPHNRTRMLFTLTLEDDGRVNLMCEAEAFKSFFNLDPALVSQQIGPAGPTALGLAELRALPDRIETLMQDAEQPDIGEAKRTWNGHDFYVVLGGRSWDDCMRFGFVSAGGGPFYSKPLEQLFLGARIFAYMPGAGYVGMGHVRDTVIPASHFEVAVEGDGHVPLLDVPGLDPRFAEFSGDTDKREYVVPVEWVATRPTTDAVWETGLFSNQVTVCRMRDQDTIDFVAEKMLGSGEVADVSHDELSG